MKQIVKNSLIAGSTLAVVASLVVAPTYQASAIPATTTITATVLKGIGMTSSGAVGLSITPVVGGAVSSNSDTITTNTNSPTGYTLTISDSDATTTLANAGNNFAALSPITWGSTATLGIGKWGYAIANTTTGLTAVSNFDSSYTAENSNPSSTSKWLGMAPLATPQTVRITAAPAVNDVTTVWYAAKADLTQVPVAYTDTVNYTATAN